MEHSEKIHRRNSDEIAHMGDHTLPEVEMELQAEQAQEDGIRDHKSITEFSTNVIETVFPCWFSSFKSERWMNEMIDEQLAENKKVA